MTSIHVLPAPQEHAVLPGPAAGSIGSTTSGFLPRRFLITAHRGAMALAPENSGLSFKLAAAGGADEIELDVRITADGVPIVLHDATLRRVAAGNGPLMDVPVAQLSLAQVRTVTLTSGHHVLTLAEALDIADVPLQIEIKDPAAVTAVARLLSSRTATLPSLRFSSFLPEALARLQQHLPDVPRGLIVGEYPAGIRRQEELSALLARAGATTLYSGFRNLTRREVERLRCRGIDVHAWPLAVFEDLCRATRLGACGGTADDPGRARGWLDSMAGPDFDGLDMNGGAPPLDRLHRIPQDCSG
ncbi:glycerophosphodiester phosphodiesterase [Pseudarthrobacter sp. NamE5]|uniref:glycerophosphodiester phosphodiesterase n=1 Tax=Pseudarthrobacter sp. NamE5 TaxID=2576839 RepID=UPI00197AF15C|nr:glycerophosphodiester phosphodiesterase [Pseudarthrobacter sp. NamE5]